jgi:hypothetical protein
MTRMPKIPQARTSRGPAVPMVMSRGFDPHLYPAPRQVGGAGALAPQTAIDKRGMSKVAEIGDLGYRKESQETRFLLTQAETWFLVLSDSEVSSWC